MKKFLLYTLATITGILICGFLFISCFIALAGALTFGRQETVSISDNTVLHIRMDSRIQDRASGHPFENIDFMTFSARKTLGMNRILACIRHAATDSRIIGIWLDLSDIYTEEAGLAATEEIRNALLEFKESGKFIYSFSNTGYSQKSYYLATASDRIYIAPEAPFMLTGLSSSIPYYRKTLDRLGIRAEVVKVGRFKSAVEPFLSEEMSGANRAQIEKYIGSSWDTMVKGIAEGRSISADSVNALADRTDFYTNRQYLGWGYFDGVVYKDQFLQLLDEECRSLSGTEARTILLNDYQHTFPLNPVYSPDKIAVIYAEGEIGVEDNYGNIGPGLAETIREARENPGVKAVVLRVNSPGGSALVSDAIWRETALTAQSKPLIVSMGNYAASGGYYISCAADTIVAEPTTLTGSIGIFGMFFSGEELLEETLGIRTETVNTNSHSDFGGAFPLMLPISNRPMTAYERKVMQNCVNQGYETFLSRVTEGRRMSRNEVHAIAQGRVWTGRDALEIGLVDVLGGLEKAIGIAAERAGLATYNLIEYPALKSPWEEMLNSLGEGVSARIMQHRLGAGHTFWKKVRDLTERQGIQARLPFDIIVN